MRDKVNTYLDTQNASRKIRKISNFAWCAMREMTELDCVAQWKVQLRIFRSYIKFFIEYHPNPAVKTDNCDVFIEICKHGEIPKAKYATHYATQYAT